MNPSLNRFPDLESRMQSALDWCKIKSRNTDAMNTLEDYHKWAAGNLDADGFFRFTNDLVCKALDLIANDRFLDFAHREFRDGVKLNQLDWTVKGQLRTDACRELNDYLRESFDK